MNQYHVVLETSPSFQKTPDALRAIYVRSSLAPSALTSRAAGSANSNSSAITSVASGGGAVAASGPSSLQGNISTGSANPAPVSSQNGGAVPLGAFTTLAISRRRSRSTTKGSSRW